MDILSIGRVQTPLLGLIVRRDRAIAQFQPRPFYRLEITCKTPAGMYRGIWVPSEGIKKQYCDEEDRLIDSTIAEEVAARLTGHSGVITHVDTKKQDLPPPLPYSLAALQIDASKQLGLSAKETLDTAQTLYETHRLVTYPRSDCQYLPVGHLAEAGAVIAAMSTHLPAFLPVANIASLSRRTGAWNDKKITAHHAIIPTPHKTPCPTLSSTATALYQLIALRYLAQFFPPALVVHSRIETRVEQELFITTGRRVAALGWQVLYQKSALLDEDQDEPSPSSAGESTKNPVPAVHAEDTVGISNIAVIAKMTQPPKHFTEATLLSAMTGIDRFVTHPQIKQTLKETCGLGTPATQATIIQTLFQRNYVHRTGKRIVSTPTGQALIDTLPIEATTPDLTAHWEQALKDIQNQKLSLERFMEGVERQLSGLIQKGKALQKLAIPA